MKMLFAGVALVLFSSAAPLYAEDGLDPGCRRIITGQIICLPMPD